MHNVGIHEDAIKGKAYDGRLLRRFLRSLLPYRGRMAGLLMILPLETLCRLSQPLILKYAIDSAIVPGRMDLLAAPAAMFLCVLLFESFLSWIEVYGLQAVGQRVMSDMRKSLFSHLMKLPVAWFDRSASGAVVTRLTTDLEALGEMFAAGIITIAGDFLLLAGIVTAMVWMAPKLSVVTFSVIPPLLFCAWLFRNRMRQSFREVRVRLGRMNAHLAEVMGGISIVQSFRREKDEAAIFRGLNESHMQANMPVITWDASLYAIVEMFSSIAIALIIWYGGGEAVRGAITIGTLVAFIQYIEKFFAPIRDLSAKYGVMQGAMASLERIFALMDEKAEDAVANRPETAMPERSGTGMAPLVEFRNVAFSYNADETVLSGFNLIIREGERVALVGESGGGKTTVVRLLGRHYDVGSGQIFLDGTDIRDMPLEQLRRSMAVVLQDPAIFAGTVAFNISLDDEMAGSRISDAASTVGADRFVERLADGYETKLYERGADLSVGERQLISFARAVAFDPRILVLDEATASVDSASEELIQDGVRRLLAGRTALVIAHRLSTVRDVDRIVVLNNGRVVEEGSHEELLAIGGEYARLYCLQFECGNG